MRSKGAEWRALLAEVVRDAAVRVLADPKSGDDLVASAEDFLAHAQTSESQLVSGLQSRPALAIEILDVLRRHSR